MAKADLKTPKEILMLAEGGKKLRQVLAETVAAAAVGMKLSDIEQLAWEKLEATGGKPAFAQVPGYRWATCINVNEGIVHGIPSQRVVKLGDVMTIDMGLIYRGFNTDTATTFQVNERQWLPVHLENGETVKKEAVRQFLKTGEQALEAAIAQAKPGNRVGHVSAAIQKTVLAEDYTPSRSLVGHGVGKALHEFPPIPCFLDGPIEATPLLKSGMTLAIEVIYSMGQAATETEADNWTIRMKDGKIAAVFEKTIAVTDDGPFVCT